MWRWITSIRPRPKRSPATSSARIWCGAYARHYPVPTYVVEFLLGRYSGFRWFSWITGVPIIWLAYASGIGGFWIVWDQLGAVAEEDMIADNRPLP